MVAAGFESPPACKEQKNKKTMEKQEIIKRLQAFDLRCTGETFEIEYIIEKIIEGEEADLVLFRNDEYGVKSSCVVYHDGTMVLMGDWQSPSRPESLEDIAAYDGVNDWVGEYGQPAFILSGLPRVLQN